MLQPLVLPEPKSSKPEQFLEQQLLCLDFIKDSISMLKDNL